MEYNLGTLNQLIYEAVEISNSNSVEKLKKNTAKLSLHYKHPAKHPFSSGINVSQRFQYSPAELVRKIEKFGFEAIDIFPVSYHSVPFSNFSKSYDDFVDQKIYSNRLIKFKYLPYASTFIIHAKKR